MVFFLFLLGVVYNFNIFNIINYINKLDDKQNNINAINRSSYLSKFFILFEKIKGKSKIKFFNQPLILLNLKLKNII